MQTWDHNLPIYQQLADRLAAVRVNVGDQHDTAPAAQRPEQAGHRIAAA